MGMTTLLLATLTMIENAPEDVKPYLEHFEKFKGQHDILKCEDCTKAMDYLSDLIDQGKCPSCGEKLTSYKDSITGKLSKYSWQCKKCMPGVVISRG